MTKPIIIAACIAAAVVLPARPVAAQSDGTKLVDVASPAAMADALRESGFKALLKTSEDGLPMIESGAGGNPFTIRFYDCENERCTSFEFYTWWKKKPYMDVALANEWNNRKRFIRTYIDKDGDLSVSMDMTAKGKMTLDNFLDWVDWWEVMDRELDKFLTERDPARKK